MKLFLTNLMVFVEHNSYKNMSVYITVERIYLKLIPVAIYWPTWLG